MRSDVPVGVTLSGGIDSSLISVLMRDLNKNAEITTFSTKFPKESGIDESDYAAEVIKKINANYKYIEPKLEDFVENIDDLIGTQDEPFGSASIFSQYSIFKEISETNIKVVIGGQGADELFFGYPGFFSTYLSYFLEEFNLKDYLLYSRKFKLLYNYKLPLIKSVRKLLLRYFQPKMSSKYYKCTGREDSYLRRCQFINRRVDNFSEYLEKNIISENLPSLLRYEDRNSMKFSIESRVPFVDREVVQFATSCSSKQKIKFGITKWILRESVKDLLPKSVFGRLDKLGFPAPDEKWLREITGKKSKGINSDLWGSYILERWYNMNSIRKLESLNLLTESR